MDKERLDKLTERQRECLRMVLRHYSSKQMARELGIGVDAVDQRLKSAMRRLGVRSRLDAARMLAEYEGGAAASGTERIQKTLSPDRPSNEILFNSGSIIRHVKRILPTSTRLWIVLASFLATFLLTSTWQIWLPVEYFLRDRIALRHMRPASGNIVLVIIDRKSAKAFGEMPWPRRHTARLFRELDRLGPAIIATPIVFDRRTDPEQDRELAAAMNGLRSRLALAAGTDYDPETGKQVWTPPLPEFARRAKVGQVELFAIRSTFRRVASSSMLDRAYRSILLDLANVDPRRLPAERSFYGDSVPIDYSIDVRTLEAFSAIDVMTGQVPRSALRGKRILLANDEPGTRLWVPGRGVAAEPYGIALAAETLKSPLPYEITYHYALALSALLVLISAYARSAKISIVLLGGTAVVLLLLPRMLFTQHVYIDVAPALFLVLLVAASFSGIHVSRLWKSARNAQPAADMARK